MTLTFALLLITAAIVAARLYFRSLDESRMMPTPSIPERIDPIETAYLRSGRGDVLRTAIVDLHARGLVTIDDRTIARAALTSSALASKNSVETVVLDGLTEPKTFAKLARDVGPALTTALAPYDAHLESERLVLSRRARGTAALIAGPVAIALPILGFALSFAAPRYPWYSKPGCIVLFMAAFVLWLMLVKVPRVTDRGRRYLARLTQGFPAATLRTYVIAPENGNTSELLAAGAEGVGAFSELSAVPLLVGLYGVASLDQTPFTPAYTAMRPPKPDNSGGCSMSYSGGGSCGCCGGGHGGGCSSGSCSSGGCGGGGCGGGGCGG